MDIRALVSVFAITMLMRGTSTNAQSTNAFTDAGSTFVSELTEGTTAAPGDATTAGDGLTTAAGDATTAAPGGGTTAPGGGGATSAAPGAPTTAPGGGTTQAPDNGTPTPGDATTSADANGTSTTAAEGTDGLTTEPSVTTAAPPPKEFKVDFTIEAIDGETAKFTASLENPESEEYKELSAKVCNAYEAAFNGSTFEGGFTKCEVSEFKNGSIIAITLLEFTAETVVTTATLQERLVEAFNNSNDPSITTFGIDLASFSVEDVTPTPTPDVTTKDDTDGPTTDNPGLSPGAIAGIAIGCVAFVVIVVLVIVFIVMKVNGGSAKVTSVEEAELQPKTSKASREENRSNSVHSDS